MTPRLRIFVVLFMIVALLFIGGLWYAWWSITRPGGNPGNGSNSTVILNPVQTGVAAPVALAFASDGRVFYAELATGSIRIIKGGAILPAAFITLPNTNNLGERGLLGLAFGPDGKLYAVVGENANPALSQSPMSLLGKVLRMNSDGSPPPDNPFVGSLSWENLIYTYGHRNMFGIAWHPTTGNAYVTENGPTCNDEVNLLVPGDNYGWGSTQTCNSPPPPPTNTNRDGPNPVLPLAWWTPTIAPTNAAFFTGSLLPQSRNHLMFGAFNDHRLRELALTPAGTSVVNETILTTAPSGILDVEMGRDGFLWVTTPSTIYRLEAAPVTAMVTSILSFAGIFLMGAAVRLPPQKP